MTAALAWGLLSALLYGTTDFIARFASKSEGVLRTMFYGQVLIASTVGAYLLVTGVKVAAGPAAWAALLVSDVALLLATACLYHAVAVGKLSTIVPVVAGYGAVGALLSIAAGDRLSPLSGAGLALAAVGAVLSAVPARERKPVDGSSIKGGNPGVTPAMGAAVLYGFGFWLQGRHAVAELGALFALWSYYALGVVSMLALAVLGGYRLRPPSRRTAPAVFGTALCAFGGYLALVLGQSSGQVAVVTALSASASAVTVLLARAFLGERIAAIGGLGLTAVICGLVLLHLG